MLDKWARLDRVLQVLRLDLNVRAIAIVGSHARGEARPDSDVDLVILCIEPQALLQAREWIFVAGETSHISREEYGQLVSLRAHYESGFEVEFGIASVSWAGLPVDPGSASVARNGMKVIYDPDDILHSMLESIERK
ncbi:MAG: nucleotidyltransferase domain-containing protein [Planctomycetales bacterium]|nr:nucleotidyltransferase domain-containing protein [bacterium]UNM07749.1 MAG: nucleotidyltransferase domain-containing protein [Planctomycetales bacterium]